MKKTHLFVVGAALVMSLAACTSETDDGSNDQTPAANANANANETDESGSESQGEALSGLCSRSGVRTSVSYSFYVSKSTLANDAQRLCHSACGWSYFAVSLRYSSPSPANDGRYERVSFACF